MITSTLLREKLRITMIQLLTTSHTDTKVAEAELKHEPNPCGNTEQGTQLFQGVKIQANNFR